MGNCMWDIVCGNLYVGNCMWDTDVGHCMWDIVCGKLYVGNCMWDIVHGTLYVGHGKQTCMWDIVWEIVYANVAEGFKKGLLKFIAF